MISEFRDPENSGTFKNFFYVFISFTFISSLKSMEFEIRISRPEVLNSVKYPLFFIPFQFLSYYLSIYEIIAYLVIYYFLFSYLLLGKG